MHKLNKAREARPRTLIWRELYLTFRREIEILKAICPRVSVMVDFLCGRMCAPAKSRREPAVLPSTGRPPSSKRDERHHHRTAFPWQLGAALQIATVELTLSFGNAHRQRSSASLSFCGGHSGNGGTPACYGPTQHARGPAQGALA